MSKAGQIQGDGSEEEKIKRSPSIVEGLSYSMQVGGGKRVRVASPRSRGMGYIALY